MYYNQFPLEFPTNFQSALQTSQINLMEID